MSSAGRPSKTSAVREQDLRIGRTAWLFAMMNYDGDEALMAIGAAAKEVFHRTDAKDSERSLGPDSIYKLRMSWERVARASSLLPRPKAFTKQSRQRNRPRGKTDLAALAKRILGGYEPRIVAVSASSLHVSQSLLRPSRTARYGSPGTMILIGNNEAEAHEWRTRRRMRAVDLGKKGSA